VFRDRPEQKIAASPRIGVAVEATIREAEVRLLALQQKRDYLRSRILELRDSGRGLKESKRLKVALLTTFAEENQFPPAQIVRPCVIWRSTRLRRACRIALIETEAPETAAQILARIDARRSYSFPEGIDAVSAIVPELRRLVLQGQAYFTSKEGTRTWGWQRS
jgi:hypothetical protein